MLCKYTQGFDVTCQKLLLNSYETKFFAVPEQKISVLFWTPEIKLNLGAIIILYGAMQIEIQHFN